VLYEPLGPIGPLDSFLLFLHWLRTGSSFERIGAGFRIAPKTLRRRTLELAAAVHRPLVEKFVTSAARTLVAAREGLPDCGLVVHATVQDRSRLVGTFEDARRYYSAKHRLYCLKSQIITDRQGTAFLIVAGIRGAVHDMQLFRQHLAEVEELVAGHKGDPTRKLADNGYISDVGSDRVVLVTPHRRPARGELTQSQQRANAAIARERVIVEDFFGRLRNKFEITDRW
jgi:hypothetical protein